MFFAGRSTGIGCWRIERLALNQQIDWNMLNHAIFLLIAYALLVFETAPLGRAMPAELRPEFLWAGLVVAAALFEGGSAVAWSAGVGLLVDAVAQQPLGVGVLAGTITGYSMQEALPGRVRASAVWVTLLLFVTVLPVRLLNDAIGLAASADSAPVRPFLDAVYRAGVTACWGLAVCGLFTMVRSAALFRRRIEPFSVSSTRSCVH